MTRHADLTTGLGRLHEAFGVLSARWQAMGELWHDSQSRQFEEEYFRVLDLETTALLERMSSLAQVIRAAEEACS